MKKLSKKTIKGIYFFGGLLLTIMSILLLERIEQIKLKVLFISIMALVVIINIVLYIDLRGQVIEFTDKVSKMLSNVILKKPQKFEELNKETLNSKIENKIKLLIENLENNNTVVLKEREAIKSLVSDVSHQVKTPIANMMIYTDTLIEQDLDKEKRIEFLKLIKGQTEKLHWLMEMLVKISRLEGGVIEISKGSINLEKLISETLNSCFSMADKKNITIEIKGDIEGTVIGDEKWSVEALFNIMHNAIKYSKENSVIQIKIHDSELYKRIDIVDKGIGIDEFEINKIFKRFYRSEEVYGIEGIGIGLYLSRDIIEKTDGFIKVISEKGKGSCFSVYYLKVDKLNAKKE